MIVSSTSGHAAYDKAHAHPYMKDGHLLRLKFSENIYQLNLQQSTGGTIAGSPTSGKNGTTFNLSATPANKYTFAGWSVTGATLTGSAGTYTNSDVTAKGNWTYHPDSAYVGEVQGPLWNENYSYTWTMNRGNIVPEYYSGNGCPDNHFIVVTGLRIRCYGVGWADIKWKDGVSSTEVALGGGWNTMIAEAPNTATTPYIMSGRNVEITPGHYFTSGSPIYISAHYSDGVFSGCGTNSTYSAKWTGKMYRLE